jgi:hypothetical protein
MSARLASGVLVSALLRRLAALGGHGAVLAKGDATAGALLLILVDRGTVMAMRERGLRADGAPGWIETGPPDLAEPGAVTAYCARRRGYDDDLWIVELDHPEAMSLLD